MAFVPGLLHDLFLSYARTDDPAWIDGLRAGLSAGLRDRLGQEVVIWKDTKELQLGDDWPEDIEQAIAKVAAFVAVVSPGYFKSVWCQKERRRFLEHDSADPSPREKRFLKIVKTPSESRAEQALLPHIQDVKFYSAVDGQIVSFIAGSEEFKVRLRETVDATAALLREMRRRREKVFTATPADDGIGEWKALRDELEAQGFDVRPDGPLDGSFADDLITRELSAAAVAVFVLTGTYDPFVERQLRLANAGKTRLIVWLHPNAAACDDAKQRALIESLRRGDVLSSGSLLDRMSSREMILQVLAALKPRPEPAPLPASGRSRVYLLYDPTTEADTQLATRVRDFMQHEPLDLFACDAEAVTTAERTERHRRLLSECDGVLLCRSAAHAPDTWLRQTVPDVLFAEQLFGRPPLASKAFLLAQPDALRGFPNVIPLTDPLPKQGFEPFLLPLRSGMRA